MQRPDPPATEKTTDALEAFFNLLIVHSYPVQANNPPDVVKYLWPRLNKSDIYMLVDFVLGYLEMLKKGVFSCKHVTPLHLAAMDQPPVIFDIMIKLGLSVTAVDPKGSTILSYAIKSGNEAVLKYLWSQGYCEELKVLDQQLALTIDLATFSNQPIVTVAFDIDGTLASGFVDKKLIWLNDYRKEGFILEIEGAQHLIHPGTLEFVRLLASTQAVELAFFSAGSEARNRRFVYQILVLALGSVWADELFSSNRIKILSNINCLPHIACLAKKQSAHFNMRNGNHTKNILQLGADPNWMVLIDDKLENVFHGQEGNVLYLELAGKFGQQQALENAVTQREGNNQNDDFYSINQLHFAAGLFFRALAKANKTGMTLAHALFTLQYNRIGSKFFYRSELSRDQEIYWEGLQRFQRVNPQASFLTGVQWHGFFKASKEFIDKNAKETSRKSFALT